MGFYDNGQVWNDGIDGNAESLLAFIQLLCNKTVTTEISMALVAYPGHVVQYVC